MLLPENCCFCVPKRCGLLIFGFLRIVITSFLAIWMLLDGMGCLPKNLSQLNDHVKEPTEVNTKAFSVVAILLVDLLFTVIFIIAGHKSYLRFHRVFFFYSVIMGLFSVLGGIFVMSDHKSKYLIYYMFPRSYVYDYFPLYTIPVILVDMFVQIYFMLLISSEMAKIKRTQYWNPRSGRNYLL